MPETNILPEISIKPENYQVKKKISLTDFDPDDKGDFDSGKAGKAQSIELLHSQKQRLAELQTLLYADGTKSLLVILQAIDAGGKDSTIRKVFSGINPQGVRVTSFKQPSAEERAHDFLWRIHQAAPRDGMIGVFNRSHYEDVLVARVKELVPKSVWSARYKTIKNFEQLLLDEGTAILKFYLHISKEEQKERFLERLHNPEKNWKFNPSDLADRAYWNDYMEAFEDAINKTSSKEAPWYIIPANRKWYRNLVIAQAIIDRLEAMPLNYPKINYDPSTIEIPD